MSFPRYPKYKDSGVEWLGEVPNGWDVVPLKHLASLKGRLGWQGLRADEYTEDGPFLVTSEHFANDRIDWQRCYHVPSDRYAMAPEIQLRPDDLLMMKDGAAMGKLAFVDHLPGPACLNSHLLLFRPLNGRFANRFLYYVLSGPIFKTYMVQERTGTTFFGISQERIGAFPFAVPPMNEQHHVLAFLDRETAKIDGLVAEQRRLIELLKEKRQAVISHAVTKGLNPHAPMKPSGIEWLGDVPEHWEFGRVKHYFRTCSGGTPNTSMQELYYTDETGIPWVRTTDLKNGVLREVAVFITERALSDTACAILPPGTVMIAMYGGDGTVGKNGLLAIRAAINQAVCGLLPSPSINSEYAFRFMQFYRPYWMIGAESSRKDPNISQERVGNAPITKPPREEQDAIVRFLDCQLRGFDALTAEAERAIDLLQERRTALISAAVTGKIDLRKEPLDD